MLPASAPAAPGWYRVADRYVMPGRPPQAGGVASAAGHPQLVATAPNQIWSWDSTKLPTRFRGHSFEVAAPTSRLGASGSGVGVDVLGSEGAPPRLEGADPGLHARDVDGRCRVGEICVVGFQRVGDGPVLLQGAFEDAGQGLPPPDTHPDGWGREAVEQHREQWVARGTSDGMVELPVELDVLADLVVVEV
jgi:hypothetical protein